MIDPVSAALAASQLAPLVAQWLEHRDQRTERSDAEAFRQWLEDQVFPRLLEQSEQVLHSIIGLKAAEKERFDTVLEHLVAIRALVGGTAAADRWRGLRPADQAVLRALLSMTQEDPDCTIDGTAIAAQVEQPEKLAREAVRYLDEQGWVYCHEHSGGWAAELTPAGLRFVWEAAEPEAFLAAYTRLGRYLAGVSEGERIGVVARDTDVPYPLAYALVHSWEEEGFLRFDDSYSPPSAGLVHHISETFRRRPEWA